MLKLILGRAGTGKTSAVLERLCRLGPKRPQVLIVPEQQSHEMERALCQSGGDRISLYAEVLSFSRLANRVLTAAGGLGEEELDGGGRLLLMYNAVKSLSGQLTVYAHPSRRPRFLQSLLETVDELKSCRIPPEALVQAGRSAGGPDGEKLMDLGLICGAYDALTAQVALDPRDRLTRVAEKLKTCPWAAGKDIWMDGFLDFTAQQKEIVRLLLRQGESLTVALTCGRLDEDEEIFEPARRTASWLLRIARQERIPFETEYLPGFPDSRTEPLAHLEKTLFAPEGAKPVPCQGGVELFRASGPRGEVEWAASRILHLVREEGLRFREIGVAARDYAAYRDLVESVFARYGVPVFSSAMSDILEKPILTLVTAALDTVAGGYSYDDMFRYLKTNLTDLPEDDRDILENYVLKWDIRGSRWTQKKDWAWHPSGYGAKWTEADKALLTRLDQLRRQVAAPLETLRTNPNQTGRGQAEALYRFLEEIGLPQRLDERVALLKAREQPELADEYRQLWEILCGGLEQCAALLEDSPMELDEFALLFRMVLSQYDVGSIPISLDRVMAGETTRQTGHPVKALILLGADDASIPQTAFPAGLLSDHDRDLLAGYGMELEQSQQELLYREMTTVYLTCARPSQRLLVTWPAQGPQGEEHRQIGRAHV